MGYGGYSQYEHERFLLERMSEASHQVFKQRGCHEQMEPRNLGHRESRDSQEHPHSLGIAFALDVTGSMGAIPQAMATQVLPEFMKVLLACGVKDPQLLFMAVGDAVTDRAPLQVGQFESTASLMDQWLTWSFLEGRGGGNGHESYELALFTLARHTRMDCWEKRRRKGYVIMTGDELPYPTLSRRIVQDILGEELERDLSVEDIIAELRETFVPFFIIPNPKRRGACEHRWRQLLGDQVLCLDEPQDICHVSAGAICLREGLVPDLDALTAIFKEIGLKGPRLRAVLLSLEPLAAALGRERVAPRG